MQMCNLLPCSLALCFADVVLVLRQVVKKLKIHLLCSGSAWSRQGGAICSIALLLLGGALVIYGGALVTVGHKPLDEGSAQMHV